MKSFLSSLLLTMAVFGCSLNLDDPKETGATITTNKTAHIEGYAFEHDSLSLKKSTATTNAVGKVIISLQLNGKQHRRDTTDANGYYSFDALEYGEYTIIAHFPDGVISVQSHIDLDSNKAEIEIDIHVGPGAFEYLSSSSITSSSSSSIASTNRLTDARDKKTYRTIQVGSDTWMAENLNYSTTSGSWCYNNQDSLCEIYGKLYDWTTAQTVCPEGWVLPTDEDFTTLSNSVGGLDFASIRLKANSDLWYGPGEDVIGFSVLPAGYYEDGSFANLRGYGDFWTATNYNTDQAWNRHFDYYNASLKRGTYYKDAGLSVRCKKGVSIAPSSSSGNDNVVYETLKDERDSKSYRTVKIGSQRWMAENLNFASASNSWCYNNQDSNCDIYGRLYYWSEAQKVCPTGWHLPSDEEFTTLTNHVGGLDSAAYLLKANSSLWWGSFGKDPYGFSTLPAGYYEDGGFYNLNGYGDFWTATSFDEIDAWNRHFDYYNTSLKQGTYHKLSGLSVRCIEDTEDSPISSSVSSSIVSSSSSSETIQSSSVDVVSSSSIIQAGELVDTRDNKTYKTVEIGTQTWMAENLNYAAPTNSWCYNNLESNCDIYGRLYYWSAALTVCPANWHLPTDAEFTVLTDYVGGLDSAGYSLKANSTLWDGYSSTDPYGFGTLPAGYYEDGGFYNLNGYGDFWTATTFDDLDAWNRHFDYYNYSLKHGTYHKLSALSVRCVKD